MARIDALNVFGDQTGTVKAKLAEFQAGIIENIQKESNTFRVKASPTAGDAKAGTIEYRRFTNSTSNPYGTARAAGKGDSLKAPPVTVSVDQKKEIVEEIELYDADRLMSANALTNYASSRNANHKLTMQYEIDSAFWNEAYLGAADGGIVVASESDKTKVFDALEDAVVRLSSVKNNFVRGVPRNLISGFASPAMYSYLRRNILLSPSSDLTVSDGQIKGSGGVNIFEEMYLPNKVDFIFMVSGAVAQPLKVDEYDVDRIPLSKAYALELYYDFGVKTLTPDLILVGIQTDATHTKVLAVDTLGTDTDTIYVTKKQSSTYDPSAPITGTNYPAGTMFTYASSTYTQYNA